MTQEETPRIPHDWLYGTVGPMVFMFECEVGALRADLDWHTVRTMAVVAPGRTPQEKGIFMLPVEGGFKVSALMASKWAKAPPELIRMVEVALKRQAAHLIQQATAADLRRANGNLIIPG
ncbi:MAG TPA: hypothetical protein VI643_03840 [Planctomycetota bacterium]|nr:hypothetical protein [Planctomycetota bacterium]